MPRTSSAMQAYKSNKIPAKCSKHPEAEAVKVVEVRGKKVAMCHSCLGYHELGKKLSPKKAAPAAVKR